MLSPVIQAHSSDRRAAMTLPTSPPSTRRPGVVRPTSGGMTSGKRSNASPAIRVRVGAGSDELTRILGSRARAGGGVYTTDTRNRNGHDHAVADQPGTPLQSRSGAAAEPSAAAADASDRGRRPSTPRTEESETRRRPLIDAAQGTTEDRGVPGSSPGLAIRSTAF